ncbi:MAG: hypothetical protein MUF49_00990 [Oculatellaceae cyanobacterium Prado106]|nr:hypothetical protein [Oculatellaceae cyanobacterium Prado106]
MNLSLLLSFAAKEQKKAQSQIHRLLLNPLSKTLLSNQLCTVLISPKANG